MFCRISSAALLYSALRPGRKIKTRGSVPHHQRALFATNARVGLVFPVLAAKEKMAIFGNVKFAPVVQGDHSPAVAPVRL